MTEREKILREGLERIAEIEPSKLSLSWGMWKEARDTLVRADAVHIPDNHAQLEVAVEALHKVSKTKYGIGRKIAHEALAKIKLEGEV